MVTSNDALDQKSKTRTNVSDEDRTRSRIAGSLLAQPPPGEEVVITGMAGYFPDSDNIYHFRENLFNKVDLTSEDTRRWEPTHPEVPQRTGKINNITKFDAGFFGISYHQAHAMDPMCRLILEKSFEAVLDAGMQPSELRGTRTGVFVGVCFSETEKVWFYEKEPQHFSMTGCLRSMIANRISYYFGLRGPSFTVDTACSSSLYALNYAYRAIREGECDAAIVGGTNLCLHSSISLQFARLGVLTPDRSCRSFDNDANGYVRSEVIAVIFLQKAKDSKRIYAQVVHSKTNCDGYKEQGITYPSEQMQSLLFEEFYEECNINPTTIDFLEAHATATKVGDVEEVSALDSVFCKGRPTPLLVGSVKSNIGHSEPASGLGSLIKVLISMECGYILPNINYKHPREGCEALQQHRMEVVTEATPWIYNTGLAGVNNFGFGGANCHVLLRYNKKDKVNSGQPKDDLPRLLCLSGRTENSVKAIIDDLKGRSLDAEYIALLNDTFKNYIPGFKYRGFAIMSKKGEIKSEISYCDENKRPLYFIFGVPTSKWIEITRELFMLPPFEATLQRAHDILSQKKINITDIIMNGKHKFPERLVTLGSLVAQIGLVELLKAMEIKPDFVFGFSLGELSCAYCDGVLTLEETILSAYSILHATTDNSIRNNLRKTILSKAVASERWITLNSLGQKAQNSNHISPEYLVDTVLNPKELNKLAKCIKSNAVVLEIADEKVINDIPQDFQDKEIDIIQTFGNHKPNGFVEFLKTLGSLYNFGIDLKISMLYPKIQYPVSRGTPMISPLLKWDHTADWYVSTYKPSDRPKSTERVVSLNVDEVEWSFLKGHVVDGRNLFPATGYLDMVWETLAMAEEMQAADMQIIFENIRFSRATNIPKGGHLDMIVMIQKGSGNFEVVEGGMTIVTGRISTVDDIWKEIVHLPIPVTTDGKDLLPLKTKDVYKELKLRGYDYQGTFRSIQECDNKATRAIIHWTGNYITFIDNMLQLLILHEDTRNPYVPIAIERIVIDAKKHKQQLQDAGENKNLPVYIHKEANTIKCGGIEIRGMRASAISRRRPLGEPVLETYKFVPNEASLTTFQSVTVIMQLILENNYRIKINVVELHDGTTKEDSEPLMPTIHKVLSNLPLIQPEMLILSKKKLELQNFTVEDRTLGCETNCDVVVATNILNRPEVMQDAFKALKENGFLLSREDLSFDASTTVNDIEILVIHSTEIEKLVLLRKSTPENSIPVTVDISDASRSFKWLPNLQEAIKTEKPVILYSQNNTLSGILGLVNCIRREPEGENIRCVFLMDQAPTFNVKDEMYKRQLKKRLAINIYKDGKWGTYRHLPLEEQSLLETKNCGVTTLTKGDLSSMRWIETVPKDKSTDPEIDAVCVYYSSLNFRDVLIATGRLSDDVMLRDRFDQEGIQGFEYAGRDEKGRRLMGICTGALATSAIVDPYFSWLVPDKWTLEEAATVPIVYLTVIYALVKIGNIQPGDSILIHAGSGGVGQAAIEVALYHRCTVFTTVGTNEKREFLKNKYPQIQDSHIGNSRDVTFEKMVISQTNGHGVNFILNSLAEEKLLASLRCLAPGGKFLEIGKFDLANNNPIQSQTFLDGRSYHGIMLDSLFCADPSAKYTAWKLLQDYIDNGAIKPLPTTVFNEDEVEQAFRFMAAGKHIGKVLVKIRDEEKEKVTTPTIKTMKAIPRYYCDSNYSYVILGGLGGFGLELADWLILRGARKLVLTSRTGIKSGYQALRIRLWRSYGVIVKISIADVTTEQGCIDLLNEANELAPVHAIFNLAVVLKDALLENQTVESFVTSFEPKAYATVHMDKVSRKLCPRLRDFVIFSSVSCGRGNAGQTNYGMANSIMERICEKRKSEGYPALAIEWGAVGDVGLVADMQEENTQLEIGGTLQQRICSCLEVLDVFLKQSEPIVASMVVAEKRRGSGETDNIVDAVLNILGITDLKHISLNSTLPELGMDSIMAVEIKQTLEREFEVFLSPQEIRSMTFARLRELAEGTALETENANTETHTGADKPSDPLQMLLRHIGDERIAGLPLIRMKSLVEEDQVAPKVFLIPGLEGMSSVFEPLAANLASHAYCLQFRYGMSNDNIYDIAKYLMPIVKERLSETTPIIAYSFGTCIALELLGMLEKEDRIGTLILIDGAPDFLSALANPHLTLDSEAEFETDLLCSIMSRYMPLEGITKLKGAVLACNSFEERMQVVLDSTPPESIPHSHEYLRLVGKGICQRMRSVVNYKPSFTKLKSSVQLFRPVQAALTDAEEDYGLSKICENKVEVKFFDGNHVTILENLEVAHAINKVFQVNEALSKRNIFDENQVQTAKEISIS